MRIGITGHRDLDETTTALVDAEIRALLSRSGRDIVGITCLADGADQIFARAVLDLGGRLEVVVPAIGYTRTLNTSAKRRFEELKGEASRIQVLPYPSPGPGPYLHAGLRMLKSADRLIAVWDGSPPAGRGGTGEIVEHALRRKMTVHVVWPVGSGRNLYAERAQPEVRA